MTRKITRHPHTKNRTRQTTDPTPDGDNPPPGRTLWGPLTEATDELSLGHGQPAGEPGELRRAQVGRSAAARPPLTPPEYDQDAADPPARDAAGRSAPPPGSPPPGPPPPPGSHPERQLAATGPTVPRSVAVPGSVTVRESRPAGISVVSASEYRQSSMKDARTLVRPFVMFWASSTSSQPTILRSAGTRTPSSLRPAITPAAIRSSKANTAVAPDSATCCAAARPSANCASMGPSSTSSTSLPSAQVRTALARCVAAQAARGPRSSAIRRCPSSWRWSAISCKAGVLSQTTPGRPRTERLTITAGMPRSTSCSCFEGSRGEAMISPSTWGRMRSTRSCSALTLSSESMSSSSASFRSEVVGDLLQGRRVVADHARQTAHGAVDDHRRHAPQHLVQLLRGQSGRGDDQPVDLGTDAVDQILLGIDAELGVDEQQLGVLLAGGVLDSTDQGREERVRDVGDQHPDHAGAAGGQPAGGAVGGVAQLAGGGQDLLTQLALDHLGSREGTRDRRGGDPHGAGDRVDRGPAHGASFRRPVWPCHRPRSGAWRTYCRTTDPDNSPTGRRYLLCRPRADGPGCSGRRGPFRTAAAPLLPPRSAAP